MPGEDCAAFAIIVGFDGWGWLWGLESRANGRELGSAAGVRQKSEVTNTAESFRALLHFDGTGWSLGPSLTTATLASVWTSGPCDVWVVGDGVYHGAPRD